VIQEVVAGEQSLLPATIAVDGTHLPTWRDGQAVVPMSAQLMAMTNFDDHASYHPALIGATLAAEQDPRFRDTIFKGGCGIKVRNIPGWNAPAAALIHARALLLAHHTVSRRAVYADDTWASVYRAGDYCMPHSHLRSNLSIVYMLDPGDQDPGGSAWWTTVLRRPADRRVLPARTRTRDAARATNDEHRRHADFASDYLHSVNPYMGKRPRITLSWNITLEKLPGRPGEGWKM
jgi:hypothetical protein